LKNNNSDLKTNLLCSKRMENNTEIDFYEIQIGNEECLVNRNQQMLQKLINFEDLCPHFDESNGLHCKSGDTIHPLSRCVIGCTHVAKECETESEYFRLLCETKKEHVNSILRNVYNNGISKPSIIQSMGILPLINGQDSIIQFQSGTGKTYTFLIGLLWGLDPTNKDLQYIFLTSTHEVATQTFELVNKLVPMVSTSLCIGGSKQQAGGFKTSANKQNGLVAQRAELRKAQIIVGTVGKTYELMCVKKMIGPTKNVRAICMDEFDQLVSPQRPKASSYEVKTEDQIKCILSMIPEYAQRAFFSATIIPDSDRIARSFFRPFDEEVGHPFMLLLNEDNSLVKGIRHYYVPFDTTESKLEALIELWGRMRNGGQAIIFVNRTDNVYKLQAFLEKELKGVEFGIFHGGMDGPSREKKFQEFKTGTCRYLIATDVLSRGIDVHSVNFIINFDMPDKLETYIHRIGRCGRFGRKGIAINFVLINRDMDEMLKVNEINARGAINKMEQLPSNIEDLL
jgi:superfamily II DNA/RNA helicase